MCQYDACHGHKLEVGNIRSATRVTRRKGVGTLLNDGEQCKMSVTRVVTVVGFTTHYSMMASEVNNLQPPYLERSVNIYIYLGTCQLFIICSSVSLFKCGLNHFIVVV